jgi:hypothetical protein
MSDDSGGSNKIGLQAILDLIEYLAGVDKYNAGIDEMTNKSDQASGAFEKLGAGTIALGTAIGNLASQAITAAVDGLKQMVTTGLELAATEQKLNYEDQALGQEYGVSNQIIQDQIEGMKSLGINYDAAATTVSGFIRYQLDMNDAIKLAKVAQDASTIANVDASTELQNLLQAIEYGRTRMLMSSGIVINQTQVYKDYAATLGTTAQNLTETQRQQAMLDAVLKEGTKNTGLYAASMQTAAGIMQQFTTTDFPALEAVMGQPWLNAYKAVAEGLDTIVKGFTKAFDIGGSLHWVLVDLGAIAELVANQFLRFAENVNTWLSGLSQGSDVIIKLGDDITINLTTLVSNFFTWGVNMATQLANGLIEGAIWVLNAVSYIADVITSLLQPGSPPKILPELDQWGTAAAEVYLQGWTQADFGAFDTLASYISTYIKAMDIPKEEVIPKILGTREAIAEAVYEVQQTGTITEDTITRITNATGNASASFREYITLTLAQAQAYQMVTDAQQELNDVTVYYNDTLNALNAQLNQYNTAGEQQRLDQLNQALAAGHLTKEEQAKVEAEKNQILLREQIRTVSAQRDVDVSAAQAKLTTAQQYMAAITAQIGLDKEILAIQTQQLDMAKQQLAIEQQKAGSGAGGGGGIQIPKLNPIDLTAISDQWSTEIEAAKNKLAAAIRQALGMPTPFNPAMDMPEAALKAMQPSAAETPWGKIQKQIIDLGTTFDTFKKQHLDPVLNALGGKDANGNPMPESALVKDLKWIGDHILGIAGGMVGFLGTLKAIQGILTIGEATGTTGAITTWLFGSGIAEGGVGLGIVWAGLLTVGLAIAVGVLIAEIIAWGPSIKANWSVIFSDIGIIISTKVGEWGDSLAKWSTKAQDDVNKWGDTTSKKVNDWVAQAGKDIGSWATQAGKDISNWSAQAVTDTENWSAQAATSISNWAANAGTDISNWSANAISDIGKWAAGINIGSDIDLAAKWFQTNVLDPINTAFGNISTTLDTLIGKIGTFLTNLGKAILPTWMQRNSPSMIEQTLAGMSFWLKQLADSDIPSFNSKMGIMNRPMYSSVSSIQNTTNYFNNSRSTNIGPINPNYTNVQSPIGIYHDITAALGATRA